MGELSRIRPTPTDEEAAVLAAVIETMWPRPVASNNGAVDGPTRWRFSGRWWHRDLRDRARPTLR
jgi:hypothetical protein